MPPRQQKFRLFIRLIAARANAFGRSRELSGLIDEEKKSLSLASNESSESEESENGDAKMVEDPELVNEKIRLLEEECRAAESEMANIQNSIGKVAVELASLPYIVVSDEEHVGAIVLLMEQYGFSGYVLIPPYLNDQDRQNLEFRLQVEEIPFVGGAQG